MNLDSFLFVGLVFAWLGLRIGSRRWLRRRLEAGSISADTALFIHAATFAVLPLLALPWQDSAFGVALLVALSAALFLGQLALIKLVLRLVKNRS